MRRSPARCRFAARCLDSRSSPSSTAAFMCLFVYTAMTNWASGSEHIYIVVHQARFSIINPRRACARVTVLGLCVCVCIRHHEFCHYAQRSVQLKVPTASAQSGKHFKYGVFSKNASFKSYGIIYIPGIVRPFHGIPSQRRCLQLLNVGLARMCNVASLSSPALLFRISFAIFRILSHGV